MASQSSHQRKEHRPRASRIVRRRRLVVDLDLASHRHHQWRCQIRLTSLACQNDHQLQSPAIRLLESISTGTAKTLGSITHKYDLAVQGFGFDEKHTKASTFEHDNLRHLVIFADRAHIARRAGRESLCWRHSLGL